jgi:hypothetical protein
MEIQFQAANLDLVKQLQDLNNLVQELTPLTGYLATRCDGPTSTRSMANRDGHGTQ